jgi:hypothetical protein
MIQFDKEQHIKLVCYFSRVTRKRKCGVPRSPQSRTHSARNISVPRELVMSPKSRRFAGSSRTIRTGGSDFALGRQIIAADEQMMLARQARRSDHDLAVNCIERLDDAHFGKFRLDQFTE